MSWSLKAVSFRMSGSGSWKRLLPDKASQGLYAGIYPRGGSFSRLISSLPDGPFQAWEDGSIIRVKNDWVLPLGPIMTDEDLEVLGPWFADLGSDMAEAVGKRVEDYRKLARHLAARMKDRPGLEDNILTILVCALTLDSWVFARLRQEVIGSYPCRGQAGKFFFWGYAFAEGPKRIFGFTTYGGLEGRKLHMIRSHRLDRRAVKQALERWENWECLNRLLEVETRSRAPEAEEPVAPFGPEKNLDELMTVGLVDPKEPFRLAIPVFPPGDEENIHRLCKEVSRKIMDRLLEAIRDFEALHPTCSFARCSRADVLCMLFHLAYSYAADRLVEQGVIPEFPKEAGGEWGVWIS